MLAGCTSEEAPTQTNAIVPGTLSGVVADVALTPIAHANVTIEGTNLSALTDAAGAFAFELLPGEYVVLATAPEHRIGALRASVVSAQAATLAFQLERIPSIVPRVDVAEAAGYVACDALVETSGERRALPCGEQDPNAQPSVEFSLLSTDGLEGALVEVVWAARTDAARVLRVDVELRQGDGVVALGGAEGASPLTISLPSRVLQPGTLAVSASPTGSFADEEAGADVGLALQQAFTAYASFFYHAPPEPGYSAAQAS